MQVLAAVLALVAWVATGFGVYSFYRPLPRIGLTGGRRALAVIGGIVCICVANILTSLQPVREPPPKQTASKARPVAQPSVPLSAPPQEVAPQVTLDPAVKAQAIRTTWTQLKESMTPCETAADRATDAAARRSPQAAASTFFAARAACFDASVQIGDLRANQAALGDDARAFNKAIEVCGGAYIKKTGAFAAIGRAAEKPRPTNADMFTAQTMTLEASVAVDACTEGFKTVALNAGVSLKE